MAFILNNFLMRLGYYRTERVASGLIYKIFDPSLLPKLRPIWGFIEFISVLPWIILRVYLPRIFRYTVVAERYVVDTVVYLGYWLGPDFFRSYLAKILLNFIPQGSLLIHLDAETQVLIKRLYYDTATIDFIVFQKKIYRVLAKMLGAVTIDTSRFGIKEVFQQIIKVLNIQQNN